MYRNDNQSMDDQYWEDVRQSYNRPEFESDSESESDFFDDFPHQIPNGSQTGVKPMVRNESVFREPVRRETSRKMWNEREPIPKSSFCRQSLDHRPFDREYVQREPFRQERVVREGLRKWNSNNFQANYGQPVFSDEVLSDVGHNYPKQYNQMEYQTEDRFIENPEVNANYEFYGPDEDAELCEPCEPYGTYLERTQNQFYTSPPDLRSTLQDVGNKRDYRYFESDDKWNPKAEDISTNFWKFLREDVKEDANPKYYSYSEEESDPMDPLDSHIKDEPKTLDMRSEDSESSDDLSSDSSSQSSKEPQSNATVRTTSSSVDSMSTEMDSKPMELKSLSLDSDSEEGNDSSSDSSSDFVEIFSDLSMNSTKTSSTGSSVDSRSDSKTSTDSEVSVFESFDDSLSGKQKSSSISSFTSSPLLDESSDLSSIESTSDEKKSSKIEPKSELSSSSMGMSDDFMADLSPSDVKKELIEA